MLEAEISPSGTVTVEGHHIGELQGFRFTADQSANGEDGKAVRGAAQKTLAVEFETRAEKFATCANADIALGSDGTLRWIGVPIGTLAASEDPLKPRVILFADEQLTGPAREKVMARAERFVAFRIETLLKPLVDLKSATELSGIGRGIAFRLVEEFGLINRRDVAEDVKSLDQAGRAALRRLGARFGAYHIFVPALIKPAPAELVTLLWALSHDGKEKPGYADIVPALASGRTSVVIDAAFDGTFYKLAGYRALGRRAVRVDILERLADLIRPALSWKAGTASRPDGAYDGSAFIVTPPMMSILGANAEDIEEILKGLGYRAEPRPAAEVKARLEALDEAARQAVAKAESDRAAAKAAAEAEAEAARAAAEVPPASEDVQAVEGGDDAAPVVSEETHAAETAAWDDGVEHVPAQSEPAVESSADQTAADAVEPEAAEAGSSVAPQAVESAASLIDAPSDVSDEARAGSAVAPETIVEAVADTVAERGKEPAAEPVEAIAVEPKPILLWRPGRFENRGPRNREQQPGRNTRPPRRDNAGGRPQGRPNFARRDDSAAPVPAATPTADARPGRDQRPGHRSDARPAREDRRDGFKPRGDRPDFRKGKPDRDAKSPPRDGRPDDRQTDRGGERGKHSFPPRPPREDRPVKVDPDSPFAKLAALRDQLKK